MQPVSRHNKRRRWQSIPMIIFCAILLSWLIFENLGLLDFAPLLENLTSTHQGAAALIICGMLAVDVLLPLPGTIIIPLAGTLFGVVGGTLVTVIGSMLASTLGYGLGRYGRRWLPRLGIDLTEVQSMDRWWQQYGFWLLIVARSLPMLAETVAISAGVSTYAPRQFFGYTLLGTLPICAVYVIAGSYAETAEELLMIAAFGFFAASGLVYLLRRLIKR